MPGKRKVVNIYPLKILHTRRWSSNDNDRKLTQNHTEPIFKKLNLLKFQDIHLLHLGQFMFSFKNSILPRKFENIFTTNNQIHNYNTRHANSFRLPLCRTNIRQFSVFYQGPKFFNSLSPEITGSSSLASFRKKLKSSISSITYVKGVQM